MILAVLLVVSLSASGTYGSVLIGNCKTIKPMPDFDLEKAVGTWYELESYPSLDKIKTKCNEHVINSKGAGKAGLLFKYKSHVSKTEKSSYSDITTKKMSEPGKLSIKPLKGSLLARPYTLIVVDTDNENYMILYSCEKKNMFTPKHEKLMILSRTRGMDDSTKVKIYDILEKNDIDQKAIMQISHEECDKE